MRRLIPAIISILALLPHFASGTEASEADVSPQSAGFDFSPPDLKALYYHGNPAEEKEDWKHFAKDADSTWYPYYKDGAIHPPLKYAVEKGYSAGDVQKMEQALVAAHRYADVNRAFEDGYRLEHFFDSGMGIHMTNLNYILEGKVEIEKPEFLTYVWNRKTGQFQLLQLGYIHLGRRRIKLFDAPKARGHFHLKNGCMFIEHNIFHYNFESPPVPGFPTAPLCGPEGGHRIGPIWMMHFAVNLYNEEGMFSDYFQYGDYLSDTAASYSFYGATTSYRAK